MSQLSVGLARLSSLSVTKIASIVRRFVPRPLGALALMGLALVGMTGQAAASAGCQGAALFAET